MIAPRRRRVAVRVYLWVEDHAWTLAFIAAMLSILAAALIGWR